MTSFRIVNHELEIDKEVTELDKFILALTDIISKHCKYVIISGFVSIFFGRARSTEDTDCFIEELSLNDFKGLYDHLVKEGYELTVENAETLYHDYLREGLSVNIWKKDFYLLRLEMKFALKKTQKLALTDSFTAKFLGKELRFGSVEAQIAYKRFIAKSEKDLEDARHLEMVFEDLDKDKILLYKAEFLKEFENGKKR
jgi:hypothetical protein